MSVGKIAFLVGAGISSPTYGQDMVKHVTSRLLNDEWHFSAEQFHPGPDPMGRFGDDLGARTQQLIRRLATWIDPIIRDRQNREPNYEDYFACLKAIVDDEGEERTNPLLTPFCSAFKRETAGLLMNSRTAGFCSFHRLVELGLELIASVVTDCLKTTSTPAGFDFLSAAAITGWRVDIFSLNHDCLIERHCDGIGVNDGFGDIDGDVTWFSNSWDRAVEPVCLFKLHGSVNWHRFKDADGRDLYARIVGDADHVKNSLGKSLHRANHSPLCLTGTTSKEIEYGFGIFGDMAAAFRERIKEHDTLFCSGYGWGDKGINIRIDEWIRRSKGKLVLMYEDQSFLKMPFWTFRLEPWARLGRLAFIPAWPSDITLLPQTSPSVSWFHRSLGADQIHRLIRWFRSLLV